ncbi:MAG TPA: phosphate ABC transporter substrate-binding protein PstS [Terriglobales bacterium]|nr:phosphate ABC transporter substrate-binding protein PstS [Terriglobales bacterium]
MNIRTRFEAQLDRGRSTGLFIALAVLVIVGLYHPAASAQDAVVLVGSGSSVPAPLYTKWAEEYNKRNSGMQMRYLPIGTSEGIKQISHGSGDFGAGEVPLTAKDRAEGNLTELPVIIIGIVPIYNLPGVHEDLKFSGEVLAEIYMGNVKNWNAPQIAKLNPNVSLPDMPIKVVFRPGGKGSNYIFSEFLAKSNAKFRSEIGITPSPKWPVGSPAERSSDMADKVKSEPGSIGYVEAQYAIKNRVQHGLVLNPAGHFVKASSESLTAACRAVEAPGWDKFGASLINAPGAESFPITSFTWVYVKEGGHDQRRSAALTDFMNWMYSNGQQLGAEQGYSELPSQLLANVKTKISSLR